MVSQASKNVNDYILFKRHEYMTQMYNSPFSNELIDSMESDIRDIVGDPEEYDARKTAIEMAYKVKNHLEGK